MPVAADEAVVAPTDAAPLLPCPRWPATAVVAARPGRTCSCGGHSRGSNPGGFDVTETVNGTPKTGSSAFILATEVGTISG